MWIVFRVDLIRKFCMDFFSRTSRKKISSGFILSDKFELRFFLKGNWNINANFSEPFQCLIKTSKISGFLNFSGSGERKHLLQMRYFVMYISFFSFDFWRKLSLSSVIEEKWIATTGNNKVMKASKRGKFRSNLHSFYSRNLKTHKNFPT